MPITFSFELKAKPEQVQIGTLFERFGWERLGAETYRYPRLAAEREPAAQEDWFNHVVPALMLFRCYVLTHRLVVTNITLDAQTSTGYRRAAELGNPPLPAEEIRLYEPSVRADSAGAPPADRSHEEQEWALLEDWLDAINFPLNL